MSRLATILGVVIATATPLGAPPSAWAQAPATQITITQPAEATVASDAPGADRPSLAG
jgi:hypothetical protein